MPSYLSAGRLVDSYQKFVGSRFVPNLCQQVLLTNNMPHS